MEMHGTWPHKRMALGTENRSNTLAADGYIHAGSGKPPTGQETLAGDDEVSEEMWDNWLREDNGAWLPDWYEALSCAPSGNRVGQFGRIECDCCDVWSGFYIRNPGEG